MAKTVALGSSRLPAPDVNALVRVTVGGDAEAPAVASEVASRVEDLTVDERTDQPLSYLIAAPWFAGDAEQPVAGTACALQWPTERGMCNLPARLDAEELGPNGLRLWRVTVTGPVTRFERRRYVRAPWELPAELLVRRDLDALAADRRHHVERAGIPEKLKDLPEKYDATALNVSEGGLLCASGGPLLLSDLPLIARFTIEQHCFETPASVIWSVLREGTGEGTGKDAVFESAIAFDDPSKYGEVLRPLVFQAQLRARRLGLM
jgi:hypothetical protein